jgi:hypothetical protein
MSDMNLRGESDGLTRFSDELNASVVDDVLKWDDHPELFRIVRALRSHTNCKAFFDTFAEAMVARQLLARGCELRFEVPTPQGKRCDFEVRHQGTTFYLHVKRLDADRPMRSPGKLMAASSRLRALERISRPYIVQVRWHEQLSADQIKQLVAKAKEFILGARVGDEMTARDDHGRELGGVRIIAPWNGSHVNVTIGLPSGFIDQAPRFRRLMHRAYQQFMPRALNLILIGSGHEDDLIDFESALLGSHIERWDAFPPRGKRVAHGRAADGFWNGQRHTESRYVGWFESAPERDEIDARVWIRNESTGDEDMKELVERLFGAD